MPAIWQQLESGWLAILVTIILAIVGIAISIQVSKKEKKPYYQILSNNLVADYSSRMPNLEVLYNHNKVDTLTISNIILGNYGNIAIRQEDLIPSNPLRISANGNTVILDTEIINQTSNTDNIVCSLATD